MRGRAQQEQDIGGVSRTQGRWGEWTLPPGEWPWRGDRPPERAGSLTDETRTGPADRLSGDPPRSPGWAGRSPRADVSSKTPVPAGSGAGAQLCPLEQVQSGGSTEDKDSGPAGTGREAIRRPSQGTDRALARAA